VRAVAGGGESGEAAEETINVCVEEGSIVGVDWVKQANAAEVEVTCNPV
jgi:hypothetical protein